jgi:hypothetical protein
MAGIGSRDGIVAVDARIPENLHAAGVP